VNKILHNIRVYFKESPMKTSWVFRTSTIFTKKERRMIQFKKLGFGILLVVIACIGIPSAEAQYGNDAWLEQFQQQQRQFTGRLMEGESLAKACARDGKGSRACKQYDEFKVRDAKRSQAIDQYIGTMEGHNAAGEMNNSINRSQRRQQYSNSASQYRQNADSWEQEYHRAMSAGDYRAAEKARQQYHYNQQKAQEYKQ
jgi:hypothetical protein